MIYRGYYTLARLYEVYHLVEKSFFHKKINFICSNQRVIFFLLHRYECFENKKKLDKKQRKNKGMTSAISSLVRRYGKYATRIPDVVSYGKYELFIFR